MLAPVAFKRVDYSVFLVNHFISFVLVIGCKELYFIITKLSNIKKPRRSRAFL